MTKLKRKRIRGSSVELLPTPAPKQNGRDIWLPIEHGILKANQERRVLISLKRACELLNTSELKKEFILDTERIAFFAGTMCAYIEPDKTFFNGCDKTALGHVIIYREEKCNLRYIFPVPKKFLHCANAALVVEHPNYKLIRYGKDILVSTSPESVDIVEGFPKHSGRYHLLDPIHFIPSDQGLKNMVPGPLRKYDGSQYFFPNYRLWRNDHYVGLPTLCQFESSIGLIGSESLYNRFEFIVESMSEQEQLIQIARAELTALGKTVRPSKMKALSELIKRLEQG
jgi:hypothetical protein